jgi:hypothetical protein
LAATNGSGNGIADDVFTANVEPSSLDGMATAPQEPFAEHPELLVGAAFVGGVLLAGLVSRFGR